MIGSSQQLFHASFHVLLACDLLAFFGIACFHSIRKWLVLR